MEQQMKIIADAVNEIMRQTLVDREEIERLREQVDFERTSLRLALEELKVSDKQIEWLRKELQGQALGDKD
jgi:hypothetical protein